MYLVLDESSVFDLQTIPQKPWRNSVVGGVLLDYETRCWWRKNHFNFPKKATDYTDEQMIEILDALAGLKVVGLCHIVHLTVDLDKAKQCQNELIAPLLESVSNQPQELQNDLRSHLHKLEKMKPQTFAKVWTLLEVMTQGVSLYLSSVGGKRAQDQRGLSILVDDQPSLTLPTLESFIWFFINCRGAENIFSFSAGVPKNMETHVRCCSQKKTLDITSIVKKIKIGKQGDKLDDRYIELRLADIVCNFMNRRFKGELPESMFRYLDQLIPNIPTIYFGAALEHQVPIPEKVKASLATLKLSESE